MRYKYRPQIVRDDSEASLHLLVCDYLKVKHPNVIFRTDFSAGIKLTMGQAIKHKALQSSRAYPDLFIAEPREVFDSAFRWKACGLFIELKREGTRVVKRDGELVADAHIREQAEMLERLRQRGYKAEFACGFQEVRDLIDDYLG